MTFVSDQSKKSCPSFGNLPALEGFIEDHVGFYLYDCFVTLLYTHVILQW